MCKHTIISNHDVSPNEVHLWSDSKTVINCIRSDSRRYKQYVAHRVAEILDCSDSSQWKWVPGTQNPADVATSISLKAKTEKWMDGPSFLRMECHEWPMQHADIGEHEQANEQRQKYIHHNGRNSA